MGEGGNENLMRSSVLKTVSAIQLAKSKSSLIHGCWESETCLERKYKFGAQYLVVVKAIIWLVCVE